MVTLRGLNHNSHSCPHFVHPKKKKKVINKVPTKREHILRIVLNVLHYAPPFRAIKQFACLHSEG